MNLGKAQSIMAGSFIKRRLIVNEAVHNTKGVTDDSDFTWIIDNYIWFV